LTGIVNLYSVKKKYLYPKPISSCKSASSANKSTQFEVQNAKNEFTICFPGFLKKERLVQEIIYDFSFFKE
jgi:hypothetical protein